MALLVLNLSFWGLITLGKLQFAISKHHQRGRERTILSSPFGALADSLNVHGTGEWHGDGTYLEEAVLGSAGPAGRAPKGL